MAFYGCLLVQGWLTHHAAPSMAAAESPESAQPPVHMELPVGVGDDPLARARVLSLNNLDRLCRVDGPRVLVRTLVEATALLPPGLAVSLPPQTGAGAASGALVGRAGAGKASAQRTWSPAHMLICPALYLRLRLWHPCDSVTESAVPVSHPQFTLRHYPLAIVHVNDGAL